MARVDFSFTHPLRVRWAEADLQGVVFNANYLLYMDVAVTEYWRHLSGNNPASLRDVIEHIYVVRTTIDFHGSAKYDDLLDVGVRVQRLGKSSMLFVFEIFRNDDLLITGNITYVHAREGKSEPLADSFKALMVAHEKVTPE
jgi:acyl-CoA thioester hydrolase